MVDRGEHADRVKAAIESNEAPSSLVGSWRRSANLHQLNPSNERSPERLSENELKEARSRLDPLIRASQESLDRLYQAVAGVGGCILLANGDGIPLERRGRHGDDNLFREWGLWPGAIWSEEYEGTNGIGTCIAEQRTVAICKDEHFLSRNARLTCITAPVYDHEGKLAAALDVSSYRDDLTKDLAKIVAMVVRDAARRIETENFMRVYSMHRIYVASAPDPGANALIAVDRDDFVVGATRATRKLFGITSISQSRPMPAAAVLGSELNMAGDLRRAERALVERALMLSKGNAAAAARDLGIARGSLYRKMARCGIRRR